MCCAEDRQGMSQEGLATAINLFHGQRQHFGQQQQQQFPEAMQHSSLSHVSWLNKICRSTEVDHMH